MSEQLLTVLKLCLLVLLYLLTYPGKAAQPIEANPG
jgi:hypothetical protein